MRIISGIYKGKVIKGYDIDGTRPTMDRVKESIFSMIQFDIKDGVCLDLFAGSGSLGIECISNYSKKTYFIDKNYEAIKALNGNLREVKEDYEVLKMDYKTALEYFRDNNIKFDVIILDPPYKLNYINGILDYISDNNLLNKKGIIVCEYEGELVESEKLKLIKEKKYGPKHVRIYTTFDN